MDELSGTKSGSPADRLVKHAETSHFFPEQDPSELPARELVALVAWDTAASLGPSGGTLVLAESRGLSIYDSSGQLFFVLRIGSPLTRPSASSCLIEYDDAGGICVYADPGSPNTPNLKITHTISRLLTALPLVQDHVDALLLTPAEFRGSRLSELASECQLSVAELVRLAVWYSAIVPYLGNAETTNLC